MWSEQKTSRAARLLELRRRDMTTGRQTRGLFPPFSTCPTVVLCRSAFLLLRRRVEMEQQVAFGLAIRRMAFTKGGCSLLGLPERGKSRKFCTSVASSSHQRSTALRPTLSIRMTAALECPFRASLAIEALVSREIRIRAKNAPSAVKLILTLKQSSCTARPTCLSAQCQLRRQRGTLGGCTAPVLGLEAS